MKASFVFLFGYYVGASRIRLRVMDLQEKAMRAQDEAEAANYEARRVIDEMRTPSPFRNN